jgi:hypothetical protein
MKVSDFENKKADILNRKDSAQEKSLALTCLSQEIRRCAWSPHAHKTAHSLAAECDKKAASLIGGSVNPAPRFDSFESGGIIHRAIK